MKKIYIIEDDNSVREELKKLLEEEHYLVVTADSWEEENFSKENPDLLLLDINLQNQNGFEICRKIRIKNNLPIIFVTSRNNSQDEIKSIMLGGDDFISKPYHKEVLLAHIKAVLKRTDPINYQTITYREITLNLYEDTIFYHNRSIELTKTEFKILYYFFTNTNRLIPKDELITYLWNNKLYVDENILNVNIARIRKKLEEIGVYQFIETVHRKGYRI